MLKLPSKRWKKVRFEAEGGGRYALSLIATVKDEQELKEIVQDIEACLNQGDRVIAVQGVQKP